MPPGQIPQPNNFWPQHQPEPWMPPPVPEKPPNYRPVPRKYKPEGTVDYDDVPLPKAIFGTDEHGEIKTAGQLREELSREAEPESHKKSEKGQEIASREEPTPDLTKESEERPTEGSVKSLGLTPEMKWDLDREYLAEYKRLEEERPKEKPTEAPREQLTQPLPQLEMKSVSFEDPEKQDEELQVELDQGVKEMPVEEPNPVRKKVSEKQEEEYTIENGIVKWKFPFDHRRATFGCGPNDPPLKKEIPVPTGPVMLWHVPDWVMATKGPAWVYQWQNQGVYPENPWAPSIIKPLADGYYDHPLLQKLLETNDLDGAMYWTFQQVLHEFGSQRVLNPQEFAMANTLASYRLKFFNKFMESVSLMNERQRVAQEIGERLGRNFFDPLEDLDEVEKQKEHRYASHKVITRKVKLQAILGNKALPDLVTDDDAVLRDILFQRYFERQVDKMKNKKFEMQVKVWRDCDTAHAKNIAEEHAKEERKRIRNTKDLIHLAYRDFLGLVLPPGWFDRDDMDPELDPREVREFGMSGALKMAEKRKIIQSGEDVENRIRALEEPEPHQNFWLEAEEIYRTLISKHIGTTVPELSQRFCRPTDLPQTYLEAFFGLENPAYIPAGETWRDPGFHNFEVYDVEYLVEKCKRHHAEVKQIWDGYDRTIDTSRLSEHTRKFVQDGFQIRVAKLQKDWAIEKSLVMKLGVVGFRQLRGKTLEEKAADANIILVASGSQHSKCEVPIIDLKPQNSNNQKVFAAAQADGSTKLSGSLYTGHKKVFCEELGESTTPVGGYSKQKRSRPRRQESRPRDQQIFSKPYKQCCKPQSRQQSRQQSKPQSRKHSKQQSKPRDWNIQICEQTEPAKWALGHNRVNVSRRKFQNHDQQNKQPRLQLPERNEQLGSGQTAVVTRGDAYDQRSSIATLWPDFDAVIRTDQPSYVGTKPVSQLSGLLQEMQMDAKEEEARDMAELEEVIRQGQAKLPAFRFDGTRHYRNEF
ncbi:hypothetical protein TWF730_002459 [Orbilia blumenaviensis]|uniref:Uncharacterized protein n=1 Tax=Orbilia blumenaviensis TaxID=1796055 RepID=A0AAV9UD04_9PEZI